MIAQKQIRIDRLANHTAMGKTAAPDKEASETLLATSTVKTKINKVTSAAAGEIIKKHPQAVATPFPPPFSRR